MMNGLTNHHQALDATFRQLVRTPLASLFTLFAIGVTLSLPAGLYVLLENLTQIAAKLPVHAEITLFMRDDANAGDIQSLRNQLRTVPSVKNIQFVSKQDALSSLSAQMGLSTMAGELAANPLPDAWIVAPDTSDPGRLKQLTDRLRTLQGVAQIQADQQWTERLHALLALGADMLAALALILAAALVSISGNTIRLQILTRHAEIEVSRLIGATDGFIRRPFLYFGAIQGLFGGLVAWGVISLGILLLTPQIAILALLYASPFRLQALSLGDGLVLLAAAAALGWLGAYLAVGRALAQIEKSR